MNPTALRDMPAAPTESAEKVLWRGLRVRLQQVANAAGNGNIYMNGQTFSAKHFQFLIDNFQPPKEKP